MDSRSLVKVTSPAEGIKLLSFNRPQKRNALSKDLIAEFLLQLASASKDPQVRVIVITGEGSFFSGKTPSALYNRAAHSLAYSWCRSQRHCGTGFCVSKVMPLPRRLVHWDDVRPQAHSRCRQRPSSMVQTQFEKQTLYGALTYGNSSGVVSRWP